ncbi:MAG: hypothetical protein R6X10_01215 [Desulfobacterales bacterium]
MDINDLFDGVAEAFQRYQQEVAEQEGALPNPAPAGLKPEKEPEKT